MSRQPRLSRGRQRCGRLAVGSGPRPPLAWRRDCRRRRPPPPDRPRLQLGRAPPAAAGGRIPRRLGLDGDPARRRPGRHPPAPGGLRPARPGRRSSSATSTPTTGSTWPAALPLPVGRAGAPCRCRVYLPPGGPRRLDALAEAISERPGFFDAAYDIAEYDPDDPAGDRAADRHASAAAGTTCRPGRWTSRRPTARGSSTPATRAERRDGRLRARRRPAARRGGPARRRDDDPGAAT